MNTTIHVDTGQTPSRTKQHQPKHQLRRKKGRIFGDGVLRTLRKISGNKSPSSSDPEDAPNRPHIVPPVHDSSDPEGSSLRHQNDAERGPTAVRKWSKAIDLAAGTLVDPRNALTPQEKLSEITELLRVRTANTVVTLQRLAELGHELDGKERQGLLTIARAAADIASREYSRVRRTQPKAALAYMLERNAEMALAEASDYKEYLHCLRLQAKEIQDSVRGFEAFQEASDGIEHVRRCLDNLSASMDRGDSAADMAEIQWWVERKCMFWAAVDILTAGLTQGEQAEGTDY